MAKHKIFEFETVEKSEIPTRAWGVAYWEKPIMIYFLEQLASIPDDKALKLTYDSRKALLSAHQTLRHRIKRAQKCGLLKANYAITGRAQGNGTYCLFVYKETK